MTFARAYGRAITGDLCGYEKRQPDSQGYEVTSGFASLLVV
jgi:hypothetical protein